MGRVGQHRKQRQNVGFPHSFQGCFPLNTKSSGRSMGPKITHLGGVTLLLFPLRANHFPSLCLLWSCLRWQPQFPPCPGREDLCVWSCLLPCSVCCVLEGRLCPPWCHTRLPLWGHPHPCAPSVSFYAHKAPSFYWPRGNGVTRLRDKWASFSSEQQYRWLYLLVLHTDPSTVPSIHGGRWVNRTGLSKNLSFLLPCCLKEVNRGEVRKHPLTW